MHIEYTLAAGSLETLLVLYNPSSDLTIERSSSHVIDGATDKIEYVDTDSDGFLKFKLTKNYDTTQVFNLRFGLQYYMADQGGDDYPDSDNCPSGAYIFKPAENNQNSLQYSQF